MALGFADLLDMLGHDGFVSVCNKPPGGTFASRVVPAVQAPSAIADLPGDIWFGVNPLTDPATWPQDRKGRGTAAEVVRLAAVYADLDVKSGGLPNFDSARNVISDLSGMLNCEPSAVVFTGHGLQPYWPIEDVVSGPDARAILRRWGRLVAHVAEIRGGHVDPVYDLARVLRVPGTTNWKMEPYLPVYAEEYPGRPLTFKELDDALYGHGAVEQSGDRDEPGSAVVSTPAGWQWAQQTCNYANKMAVQWHQDMPPGRHPWLLAQATRIEVAHRYGCFDHAGYNQAAMDLQARFRALLATGQVRKETPGEIVDAFTWGRTLVSTMTDEHVRSELGGHVHRSNSPWDLNSTGKISTPESAFSQPGTNVEEPGTNAVPFKRVRLVPAAEIEPEPVVWTWLGRIPRGEITLTPGRGGIGKSTFHAWLIAKLTLGTLPGIHYGIPSPCIIAATEDSWSRTIVPRLTVAGADLNRVYRVDIMTAEEEGLLISLPRDLPELEQSIAELGAVLLSVDPLMGVIDGRLDTHKDRDVRQALTPLMQLGDRTQCTILGNAHFNKGTGSDPLALVMGSAGFGNVARAVLGFARDPDADEEGTCVISLVKNNLGRLDLPSLTYRIENMNLETPKGIAEVGRLVMTGESSRSVADILAAAGVGTNSKIETAAAWVKNYVTGKPLGYALANDVILAGQAAGFSVDWLKKARSRAGLSTVKKGMPGGAGGWYWCMPGVEPSDEDAEKVLGFPGFASSASSAPSNNGITESYENLFTESDDTYEGAEGAKGAVPRAREHLREVCSTCGNPLLLIRPGRTQCERCRLGGVIEGQVS